MPPPHKDITGQRFGLLTAVSRVGRGEIPSHSGGTVWLFRCDCGNSCTRRCLPLTKAVNPPSCGCSGQPSRHRHWASRILCISRKRMQLQGLQCELSVERFGDLMSKPCHYCGAPPSTPISPASRLKTKDSYHVGVRNGIDRVDSSLGYVEGNCVPCCFRCNRMKLNHAVTDFLAHVSAIHHHNLCVPNIIHIKHHAPPLIHPNSLVHAGGVSPLRAAAAGS